MHFPIFTLCLLALICPCIYGMDPFFFKSKASRPKERGPNPDNLREIHQMLSHAMRDDTTLEKTRCYLVHLQYGISYISLTSLLDPFEFHLKILHGILNIDDPHSYLHSKGDMPTYSNDSVLSKDLKQTYLYLFGLFHKEQKYLSNELYPFVKSFFKKPQYAFPEMKFLLCSEQFQRTKKYYVKALIKVFNTSVTLKDVRDQLHRADLAASFVEHIIPLAASSFSPQERSWFAAMALDYQPGRNLVRLCHDVSLYQAKKKDGCAVDKAYDRRLQMRLLQTYLTEMFAFYLDVFDDYPVDTIRSLIYAWDLIMKKVIKLKTDNKVNPLTALRNIIGNIVTIYLKPGSPIYHVIREFWHLIPDQYIFDATAQELTEALLNSHTDVIGRFPRLQAFLGRM